MYRVSYTLFNSESSIYIALVHFLGNVITNYQFVSPRRSRRSIIHWKMAVVSKTTTTKTRADSSFTEEHRLRIQLTSGLARYLLGEQSLRWAHDKTIKNTSPWSSRCWWQTDRNFRKMGKSPQLSSQSLWGHVDRVYPKFSIIKWCNQVYQMRSLEANLAKVYAL